MLSNLMVLFQVGEQQYALNSRAIVAIVPLVETIAGAINYHGTLIPVIDLSQLIQNQPSRPCFGTRIMVIETAGESDLPQTIGLLAEQVVDTINVRSDMWRSVPKGLASAPYLGDLIFSGDTPIRAFVLAGLSQDHING
jgi:chemotaxis-related protein WspB